MPASHVKVPQPNDGEKQTLASREVADPAFERAALVPSLEREHPLVEGLYLSVANQTARRAVDNRTHGKTMRSTPLPPVSITSRQRIREVGAILATGYLRTRGIMADHPPMMHTSSCEVTKDLTRRHDQSVHAVEPRPKEERQHVAHA